MFCLRVSETYRKGSEYHDKVNERKGYFIIEINEVSFNVVPVTLKPV